MIDKYELLDWIDYIDNTIDYKQYSDDVRAVHHLYMNTVREHVLRMKNKRLKYNELSLGIVIGAMVELVIMAIAAVLIKF